MKYIRRFNEDVIYRTPFKDVIQFCKNCLAFLIDEGFDVKVEASKIDKHHKVLILFGKNFTQSYWGGWTTSEKFNYSDIKDDFIPFLEELVRLYEIETDFPKETTDYHNRFPKSKFTDKEYKLYHRTDLPEICKVEFINNGDVIKTYPIKDIIDEGTRSILHKDRVYEIQDVTIDMIQIKI
jgi:hypothetical protein